MPTILQFRRGTTAQNNNYTGSVGEITVDTDLDVLRVHDGATSGGFALVGDTATQTLTNKTLTSPSISSPTVTGTLTAVTINAATIGNAGAVFTGASISAATIGNASSAYYASTSSTASAFKVPFLNTTGTTSGAYSLLHDSAASFTYNPSTDTLVVTNVTGTSSQAKYADLAENYQADHAYPPGTVVVFGGENEVTQSTTDHDTAIAGVVSTAPAYLMNSELQNDTAVSVALAGRVPCRVQGPVNKGTVLVSGASAGTAQAIDNTKFAPGCIIGKAMEAIADASIQTIEISVGRS